jgi:hypothetical protein
MYKENERIAKSCPCCDSRDLRKSPAILMPFIAHRIFGWQPVEIDESWGLKTIRNGYAYSLCNSLCCIECGFLFLDIRFSDDELETLYKGYRDEKYVELREFYEPGYRERNQDLLGGIDYIDQVEKFLMPHLSLPVKILDWGGDTGKNSPFKSDNKCWHIYDISNQPVIPGAILVDKKTVMTTPFYDLIICSNVMEHVPYPAQLLQEIQKVMKKNTVLYIEVPHEAILRIPSQDKYSEQYKKHWHEHINFFTENSLIKLIEKSGMKALSICSLEVTVGSEKNNTAVFQIACKLSAS